MLIINPIYDASFKYLMDHTHIAKGLISLIIGEEIIELTHRSQEAIATVEVAGTLMNVYRMDFTAKIKTKENQEKQILIELQKSKIGKDVIRFRKYLGLNYQRHEVKRLKVKKQGGVVAEIEANYAIPIISIYFLGYTLSSKIAAPIVYVKRSYVDQRSQKVIKKKDKFIESLTHDAYFIQIPHLQEPYQSRLEEVLSIFDQHYKDKDDEKLMRYNEHLTNNELLVSMLKVLNQATQNVDLKMKMELEEAENLAIRNRIALQTLRHTRKIVELEDELEQKETEISRQKEEAERQKEEAERQKEEAERQKEEAERQKEEAERQKEEAERQKEKAEKAQDSLNNTVLRLHSKRQFTTKEIADICQITIERVNEIIAQNG